MTKPLFDRVAILGVGLIGSSLALAIRRGHIARHVVGHDRNKKHLAAARRIGFADSFTDSAAAAVKGADLVILAVPVGAAGSVAKAIASSLKPGAIVTDVGSVKGAVISDVGPQLPKSVHFIPAHPIAGTERSGPDAGFSELFDGRWCILTPPRNASKRAITLLTRFWERLGSKVDMMDPKHHDLVLAVTSHVPHLIAYNIVGTADDLRSVTEREVIQYSAGGFRDFTRIAASDPTMWRDVFLNNREAVLEVLGRFSEDLSALQRQIRWGDGDALFKLFTRTRAIRRGIVDAGQDSAAVNFGRNAPSPAPRKRKKKR
jgi:cyclohexadieny/prephenate dehydrogenase